MVRTLTTFLYTDSFGVVVGVTGSILTRRLEIGALAALVGFVAVSAGYACWRVYRRPRPAFLGRPYHTS